MKMWYKICINNLTMCFHSANYWMISVADYGQGIPESVKENLFERFYSKASGTGFRSIYCKSIGRKV